MFVPASNDRIAKAPATPFSGLYRISPTNISSTAFRERSSTNLFEGRQQLYHQQLSAAVRAGQQLKMVDEELDSSSSSSSDGDLSKLNFSEDFCQDRKTRKVISLSAGCRHPTQDDLQIRSTCEEDPAKGNLISIFHFVIR